MPKEKLAVMMEWLRPAGIGVAFFVAYYLGSDAISRFHILAPFVVVLMSGTVAFEFLTLGEVASVKIGYAPNRAYQIQSGLASAATAIMERNMKPVNLLRPVMAVLLVGILPPLIKALTQ
jgi:hypothetical protein